MFGESLLNLFLKDDHNTFRFGKGTGLKLLKCWVKPILSETQARIPLVYPSLRVTNIVNRTQWTRNTKCRWRYQSMSSICFICHCSEPSIQVEASMCHLRGVLMLKLNRGDQAKQCFMEALALDVKCYDAFDQLVTGEMMTPDEGGFHLLHVPLSPHSKNFQSGSSYRG